MSPEEDCEEKLVATVALVELELSKIQGSACACKRLDPSLVSVKRLVCKHKSSSGEPVDCGDITVRSIRQSDNCMPVNSGSALCAMQSAKMAPFKPIPMRSSNPLMSG